jgi:ATP-binding cassette subfamily B protein
MMLIMVPRAAVSSDRIQAVLDVESVIHDPANPVVPAAPVRGLLQLTDVEFRYPGAEDPVLRGVSFVARPGEVTALVGSTGSGKSTVVNLVPRLQDVTAGSVLVDGVDVRDLTQEDLRSRIGFVPQRAMLFSGTVGSNVRFGAPDATDDEVWDALRVAQASDFVERMAGLETRVEQGGSNLSGGQRQRLAIARAVVRQPAVFVFDDSFSALDYTTDARLRSALRGRTVQSTVLVVAQRVSTIRHADQIVVLDAGRVVGAGTHDQLLRTCSTYQEIVASQLRDEEVA